MERPKILWFLFLGVWAFTLLAYGAVTVPCSAAALAAVASLYLVAIRILPEPLRLTKAGIGFLAGSLGLFALQLLPIAPALFPVTQSWRMVHGVGWLWPATADTFRTLLALAQFLLYVLSALLILKLRQSGLAASTILKGALALLSLEALYGLVQVFANLKNIPFYGEPRPAADSASGTLVGRNNFAGLMATGFVLAIAFAWGRFSWPHRRPGEEGKPRWMRRLESGSPWALGAGLFAVAIVLSRSRGGALAALGGAALLPFLHRGRASVVGAAAIGTIAAAAAVVAGLEPLLERFGALDPYDLTADDRWKILSTTVAAALHQPVLGFGLGSHPVAYHPYQPPSLPGQIHHAHNEYINLFFEAGLVGVLFLVGALAFWFIRAWRAQRPLPSPDRLHVTTAIAAVAVTALHSFVDFDLRIPSNGILFGLLIGAGAAATRTGAPRSLFPVLPGLVALAAAAALFLPLDPVPLFERARGTADTVEMERLASRALALSPYEYRAAWTLARAAQRKGDLALADRRFEIASDLWPAHPGVQREAGLWFWESGPGGLERAAKCFHRLFEQNPSEVSGVMAEISRMGARRPEEVDHLVPPLPGAVAAYAGYLAGEREWTRAVQVFERGVPATPENAPLFDAFAEALHAAGQWGLEAMTLKRRLEVKSDASAYARAARAWLQLGALDLAMENARLAAQIDLGNAAWPALKGEVFRRQGRPRDAQDAYTEAIAKAPMELAYREARARAYAEDKMYGPAAEDFKAALRSKPRDRGLVLGLAQALAALSQNASARMLLDDYLRKFPDDLGVRQYRDSLSP